MSAEIAAAIRALDDDTLVKMALAAGVAKIVLGSAAPPAGVPGRPPVQKRKLLAALPGTPRELSHRSGISVEQVYVMLYRLKKRGEVVALEGVYHQPPTIKVAS